MMEEFKFETGCTSKGWYCEAKATFFGKTAKDAEDKAKAYVRALTVREEMEEAKEQDQAAMIASLDHELDEAHVRIAELEAQVREVIMVHMADQKADRIKIKALQARIDAAVGQASCAIAILEPLQRMDAPSSYWAQMRDHAKEASKLLKQTCDELHSSKILTSTPGEEKPDVE